MIPLNFMDINIPWFKSGQILSHFSNMTSTEIQAVKHCIEMQPKIQMSKILKPHWFLLKKKTFIVMWYGFSWLQWHEQWLGLPLFFTWFCFWKKIGFISFVSCNKHLLQIRIIFMFAGVLLSSVEVIELIYTLCNTYI
jgi:hypothetical protein